MIDLRHAPSGGQDAHGDCAARAGGRGAARPLEPLQLLLHIWAVTQHYADYEPQVAFFRGHALGDTADRERLIEEVTEFVLRGAGVRDSR